MSAPDFPANMASQPGKTGDAVANLALIQVVPGAMTDNLERALLEPNGHPWAFDKTMSQMKGIVPKDLYVAFVRATLPSGSNLGRQGPIEMNTRVSRVVLGRLSRRIQEAEFPYFPGFPFEFWYELVEDIQLSPDSELKDAAEAINARVPSLGISGDHLRELLSNARSAKVGLYYDGMPRKATYFKDFEEIPILGHVDDRSTAEAPNGPEQSHAADTSNPFGSAADAFSRAVEQAGLIFGGVNEWLPRALFAAVGAKRFAILTGMSGSGKTQIARALGQWLGSGPGGGPRYIVVPVRADWTSPEPMLGYEDAILPPSPDGRRAWHVPETLQFILRARADSRNPWLLVLDEMNLAHVERYFADVLSGIESAEPIVPNLVQVGGYWYEHPSGPSKVPLPTNLIIIGTVNVDETTYQFSPKVLDRAFSFEFRVTAEELATGTPAPTPVAEAHTEHRSALLAVMTDPNWHITNPHPTVGELATLLLELHGNLEKIGFEFGHRSYRESQRFAATLAATGLTDPDSTWDWVVMTKVLPRVHGGRRQLESFLGDLNRYAIGVDAEKPPRPLVARKTARMLRSLQSNQFAGFSE